MASSLRALHGVFLLVWLLALVTSQAAAARARKGAPDREIAVRRRIAPVLAAEHVALALVLLSGTILLSATGHSVSREGWLSLKVGLVAFLVVPLEAMHAYVCHFWIRRGLERSRGEAYDKDLLRGLGIEEMLRTLSIPLLGLGVPLLLWLSLSRPF